MTPGAPADLVLAATALAAPPCVPEVRLHLAGEPYAVWLRTEEELGRSGLPLPFWAFAWAGGQALARHVLDHPDLVRGLTVLDVASGSGLVAIAAARAGAAAVTATDVDPFALAAIRLNAAANDVALAARLEDVLDGDGRPAGVVLAGDVFYDQALAERVLPFLERAAARGAAVLVGDPDRYYLPRPRLEAVAAYDVPVPPELEGSPVKRTTVWRPLLA
jgi:predicted nicotinamide N-methyase